MEIKAQADAVYLYLKEQIKTPGQAAAECERKLKMQNAVAKCRCWIERRGGELLREVERKKPKPKSKLDHGSPLQAAYREVGGATAGKRMEQVAALPEKQFQKMVDDDREVTLTAVRREARQAARRDKQKREAHAGPLPDGTFRTIVADPPWSWEDEGDHEQLGRGTADYPTMPLADILAMPVLD